MTSPPAARSRRLERLRRTGPLANQHRNHLGRPDDSSPLSSALDRRRSSCRVRRSQGSRNRCQRIDARRRRRRRAGASHVSQTAALIASLDFAPAISFSCWMKTSCGAPRPPAAITPLCTDGVAATTVQSQGSARMSEGAQDQGASLYDGEARALKWTNSTSMRTCCKGWCEPWRKSVNVCNAPFSARIRTDPLRRGRRKRCGSLGRDRRRSGRAQHARR